MNKFNIKIIGYLLAFIGPLFWAGAAHGAATIYSPSSYDSFVVNTNVTFRWNTASAYNYITIYDEGWSEWEYLGASALYPNVTRASDGWLAAQVATWENNQWEYSNVVWIYFYTPVYTPPPPPVPAPGGPALSRTPADPVYQGDVVAFAWNQPANTADFYILYRRNGVWDSSWAWLGLAQSQNFSGTGALTDLAAQVAACNSSGCGYSNIPAMALEARTPAQMDLSPLAPGTVYQRSLNSPGSIKYEKITNTSGVSQVYSARVTADAVNAVLAAVDGAGNINNADLIFLSPLYLVIKVEPGQDRYLKFSGANEGAYTFTFNRFRNFPFFEGS